MNGRLINEIKEKLVIKSSPTTVGKLRIGEKNERGLPTSLDYFKATGTYADKFNKEIGQVNKLQITFPSNNAKDCCYELLEFRDKKTGNLIAKGDGSDWLIWDYNTEKYIEVQNSLDAMIKDFGKPDYILRIKFIILQLKGVYGIWELETKGRETSIPNILATFDLIVEQAGVHFTKVPFDLIVERVKSNSPYKFARKYSMIKLVPNLSYENMILLQEHQNVVIKNLLNENSFNNKLLEQNND
jgi:hypothetical protein